MLIKIRKTSTLVALCAIAGYSRRTTRQHAKLLEVYCVRVLGGEIRVEKVLVGELIIGVVVDVLGHVSVEHFKSSGVGWIPGSAWHFVVWNSPEFVVLHPKVGLEDFRSSRKP